MASRFKKVSSCENGCIYLGNYLAVKNRNVVMVLNYACSRIHVNIKECFRVFCLLFFLGMVDISTVWYKKVRFPRYSFFKHIIQNRQHGPLSAGWRSNPGGRKWDCVWQSNSTIAQCDDLHWDFSCSTHCATVMLWTQMPCYGSYQLS